MEQGKKTETIRTKTVKTCFICGSVGKQKYTHLKDRLFTAPGEWSFHKCVNHECGLIWLSPQPVSDDISKLYENYITHDVDVVYKNKIYGFIKRGVLCFLKIATVIGFEWIKRKNFYLSNSKPGRLLEVGCGDGCNLALLRKRGWEVEGQDIDPKSAEVAKTKHHCNVHVGSLKSMDFSENSFDVIITVHVVEHLDHPEEVFAECYRILKPGGKFVSIMPNGESLAHKFFKQDWVGLDAPRHFQVFSNKSLVLLSKKVGFKNCECWTTSVNAALLNWISFDIRKNIQHPMNNPTFLSGLRALRFKLWASIYFLFNKNSGEECVLVVKK